MMRIRDRASRLSRPPRTRPLTRAHVLGAGALTLAFAASGCVAPTCGPCCHGGGPECTETDAGTYDAGMSLADAGEDGGPIIAPTCGPCCHSPELPECNDAGLTVDAGTAVDSGTPLDGGAASDAG